MKNITDDLKIITFIRDSYMISRIFELFTNEDITKYLEMYIDNLIELNWNGKCHFEIKNNSFGIKYVELTQECIIRNIDIEMILKNRINFHEMNAFKMPVHHFYDYIERSKGKKCLFRYTKKSNLTSFQQGKIGFHNSEEYKDECFNHAVLDDEKSINIKSKRL